MSIVSRYTGALGFAASTLALVLATPTLAETPDTFDASFESYELPGENTAAPLVQSSPQAQPAAAPCGTRSSLVGKACIPHRTQHSATNNTYHSTNQLLVEVHT